MKPHIDVYIVLTILSLFGCDVTMFHASYLHNLPFRNSLSEKWLRIDSTGLPNSQHKIRIFIYLRVVFVAPASLKETFNACSFTNIGT